MKGARLLSIGLVAASLLSACDPFDDSAPSIGGAPTTRGAAASQPSVQQSADTLARALTLLNENYVEGADLGKLVAASQKGAWEALAEAGVPPQDADQTPPGVLTESTQALRQRFVRAAVRSGSKVQPGWLAYQMIRSAANSLDDCHTGFLTPQQVQDQVQRLNGTTKFSGIGVLLRRVSDKDQFTVVEVFRNSPAEKAGVRAGDLIVSVDGTDLKGLGLEQVVNMVRGPEGTATTLGISRLGSSQPIQIAVTRGSVSAPVLRSEVLDGGIGYVKFYGFPEPLTGELDTALRTFDRQRVTALIVDLRDNAGGQLDVVTKVTSRFVPDGPLFQGVSQTGDHTLFYADGNYWLKGRRLAVLVNGGTGSGGEILASAVKEHRSGTLVGTKTAGCVSTGQMFPLPDGSAIEIATNRVVSGLRGAELNRVGVTPDVAVDTTPADLANQRDVQLTQAVELLLRR